MAFLHLTQDDSISTPILKHTDPRQHGFGAEDRGIFLGSNRSHHDRAGPQEQACDDHRAAKQRGNRKSDLSPQGLREPRFAATTRYLGHEIEGIDRPNQDPQGSGARVKRREGRRRRTRVERIDGRLLETGGLRLPHRQCAPTAPQCAGSCRSPAAHCPASARSGPPRTQHTLSDPAYQGRKPGFVDYLFLAFTTATAFSASDVLPLTARAKLLIMLQALISLITVALVASRAVGILQ